jgi:hypothetical protein
MRNADITGQHNFCFDSFNFATLGMIMNFTMNIPTMRIVGLHQTETEIVQGVPIRGNGAITMDINNIRVNIVAQLNTLPGGFLNVREMRTGVVVGTVNARLTGFGSVLTDGTISRLVSSAAPGMVSQSQDQIDAQVRASLMPALNLFLNRQTMASLVTLMAGRVQNPPPRRCFGTTPRNCPPIF